MRAAFLDSSHQKIDVASHETLLGSHGAIAEAEGKVAPYQCVIVFCLAQDIVRYAAFLQVEVLGLGMFDLTALVRVDVGPGLRINEGYLVRCQSHDRSVFLVEFEDLMGKTALDIIYGPW